VTRGQILIAGAGIAGLATALALAQRGYASDLLEVRAEPTEAGAGIQIGPNGVRCLQSLGVADSLRPAVAEPDQIIVRSGVSGAAIADIPLGRWIADRHGQPYWTAHRQDLHRALLDAARAEPRITIAWGQSPDTIIPSEEGVVVTAADGRSWQADGLIGADGIWSRVRAYLSPVNTLRFVGKCAARTVIPSDALPADVRTTSVGLWLAAGAHLVHYPIRNGREIAVVLITDDASADRDWVRAVEPGWIETAGRDLAAPARAVLAAGRDWRSWSLAEGQGLARWSRGRVTLAGDAAHPVLPFLAQGAVMALEDALVLAECVAATGEDIAAAFEAYERVRITRTAHLAAVARRNGRLYHLAGLPAAVRDLGMRALGGRRLIAGYDWLYGWRPER
jgi:salicylate hydroxylase